MTLLDAAASTAARDAGMQLALDFAGDGWAERVVDEFRAWAAAQKAAGRATVTIEQFRAMPHTAPASHKAYGSLPRLLLRAGVIAPALTAAGDPVYERAAAVRTHGHPVRSWRVL